MAFVSDTFTDTAGTNLSSHTGETGASWTIHTDGGGNGALLISDANRLRCSALGVNTATALYYASGTPSGADYSVEADFVCLSAAARCGILLRYVDEGSGANGDGYFLEYRQFFGWRLWVFTNGVTTTQIGSTFGTELTAGQTAHAKLTVSGSSFTVDLTGDITQAGAITGSDSTYSAAGQSAVAFLATDTNSTGVHLDNFQANDPSGVPTTWRLHSNPVPGTIHTLSP